jgi:hypothetical protein
MMKCWVVVAASLVTLIAHADLKELIEENKNNTAVVTSVSESADSDYGLLVMPSTEFSNVTSETTPGKLENDYFNILDNEGTETLSNTDFDGDNVFYHLTKARAYYARLAENSGFSDSAFTRKINVRVRVTEYYNPSTHFTKKLAYNDARYIPAEDPIDAELNKDSSTGQWNQEIWFQSRKGILNMKKSDWAELAINSGISGTTGSWASLPVTIPLEIYEHYNAGLDPAKLPNVIYHECFHYVTDAEGYFPMASEGNPVAEDYANYFGSSINGKPEIAELNEFSSGFYKRSYKKIKDVKDTKESLYNATSFGPSMFWQIQKWLGRDRADQLIWNSLRYLKGSSKHTDVPKALSLAVQNDSALSADEVSEIQELLSAHQKSYENLEKKFSGN